MRHGKGMGDMFEIQAAVAALPAAMRVMLMRSGDGRLGRYCPICGKAGKIVSSAAIGPCTYRCGGPHPDTGTLDWDADRS